MHGTYADYLWKIAPPPIFSHDHCPPVASQNSSSVLSQLKCQLCSNLLTQPLELPCSALVCTKCIVEWVAATGAENCPCCLDDGPLLSSRIRPASNLILLLLADILVHCVSCSRDVKADAYEAHKCTPSLTPNEEWEAVVLLKKAISTSTEKGGEEIKGAPLIYIPELVAKIVHLLEENERTRRLTWHEGFIPASEVWIKIGGDKGGGTFKMNFQIVNIATPNSVHNTCVFCCFAAGDSVTHLHAALDRFKDQVEHLNGMKWRQYTIKIFTCGNFEFLSKMYGLSGASGCYPCPYCIIHSEMMATPLSVRGHAAQRTLETMRADHQRYVSAGSIKRDAQKFYNCISPPIFDIPVSQVCPPGLHITLGIFTKMFNLLEAVCCNLDLELALHATDIDSSSFSKYSLELQNLPLLQAELEEAQQAQENFQRMATYVVLVGGAERNPRAVNLLKQAADKKKHVKALFVESTRSPISANGTIGFRALKPRFTISLRSGIFHGTLWSLAINMIKVMENLKLVILLLIYGTRGSSTQSLPCHTVSGDNCTSSICPNTLVTYTCTITSGTAGGLTDWTLPPGTCPTNTFPDKIRLSQFVSGLCAAQVTSTCGSYTASSIQSSDPTYCLSSILTVNITAAMNGSTVTCYNTNLVITVITTVISSATIYVVGPPGAPNVVANIIDADMVLVVVNPSSSGGLPTSYSVTISNSSYVYSNFTPAFLNGSAMVTFTELTIGTNYTISAVAINCAGLSNPTTIYISLT
eukprot:Em0006g356a